MTDMQSYAWAIAGCMDMVKCSLSLCTKDASAMPVTASIGSERERERDHALNPWILPA